MRKGKHRHRLPCVLTAVCVLLLLIVLPRADSVSPRVSSGTVQPVECAVIQNSASGSDSGAVQNSGSGQAAGGSPASGLSSNTGNEQTAGGSSASSSGPDSNAGQSSSSGQTEDSSRPASGPSSVSGQSSGSGQTANSDPVSGPGSSAVQSSVSGQTVSGKEADYQFENDDITVTVIPSDTAAMPQNAVLCVTPITEETDGTRYRTIESRVADSLETGHRSVTGLLAYDIRFTVEGKEIEPGAVTIVIQYKHGIFASSVGKVNEEIRFIHLKDANGETQVEDITGTAKQSVTPVKSLSGGETMRFVTGSLSVFAVAGVKTAAKTGTEFSASQIRNSLSPVLPYAVFADYFKLTTHLEGCIAVNTANIGADFGNSDANFTNYSKSSDTVTVEKTYTGTTVKTFRFGLYDKSGAQIGDIQSITLPTSGKNTGTVSFQADGKDVGDCIVNELDSKGNFVTGDDPLDGFILRGWEKGEKQTSSSTMNCTSYISSLEAIEGSHQFNTPSPPNPQNKLVAGSGCQISGSDVICGNGAFHCYDSKNLTRVAQGQKFPINFTKVLGDMADLSVKLAQAVSSDTVMVENFTPSQLSQDNCKIDAQGKLLLININATGCKSFEIPAQFKLNVDGESQGGWTKAAANIVVNVYTNDGGVRSSYKGNISRIGYVMGTFLAPLATITDTEAVYNGTIVAKRIECAPSEIHCATGGYCGESITWKFKNEEDCPAIVLPQTGGPGTSAFYGVGCGILLLGAVLAILSRISGKRSAHSGSGRLFFGGCGPPCFFRRILCLSKEVNDSS